MVGDGGHPGVEHPGVEHPGVEHPGVEHPGVEHPGAACSGLTLFRVGSIIAVRTFTSGSLEENNPVTSLIPKVPIPTLERLATYLRYLIDLEAAAVETISSTDVEKQTGINAAQFRKDLSYFGEFGKPGVGYNVVELQTRIARILKIDQMQPVIVIGAGNLGSALIGYPGLREHKFHIAAAFDSDPTKIGRPQGSLVIQDGTLLRQVNARINARIAIIAVPASVAQAVAETAISAGVRVILNFAPILLKVPERIVVRNVSFLQELAVLSYHLSSETNK